MSILRWIAIGLCSAALGCGGRNCTAAGSEEAPSGGDRAPVVRIGSKSFTENVILGEMLAYLARDAGAQAIHRGELGGTQIVYKALIEGDIDVYPEYTGTLTAEILKRDNLTDLDAIGQAIEPLGLRLSRPLGFNNTYALGMKEVVAQRRGIRRISDLALPEHAGLRLGFSDEFMNRGDGWPGLKTAYQLPHRPRGMDHNLAYRGLEAGSIDVTDLYSTDAEVEYYQLRLLDDDREYFPHYRCVLLYRAELEDRLPKVVASLKRLEGAIDNRAMVTMNSRAKLDGVHEAQVAADFLTERLNITATIPAALERSRWRQILDNLLATTAQHLFLVGVSLSAAVIVAIPLGIAANQLPRAGHAILGAVGVIQTLPSMAVLVFMIPLLGLGAWPAIVALFLYSLLPIVRGTVTGLREIPAHLRESAIVLGLSATARLRRIELPMASRSILSGIKTAAVINVGTATLGALIGAGGYGQPILTGIRLDDMGLILQGAAPAALMALLVQALFDWIEPLFVPRGLRLVQSKD